MTIFLEEGIVGSSKEWSKFFKGVSLEEINIKKRASDGPYNFSLVNDFNHNLKTGIPLSASALQSYLDCPRKFYLDYLEKMSVRPSLKEFTPAIIGEIEHKVIELVLTNHRFESNPVQRKFIIDQVISKYVI